jgi:hypothetical protein
MKSDTAYREESESKELGEIALSKFKSLAKEYFQIEISLDNDHAKVVKDSSRFFSFRLPNEISEIFIHITQVSVSYQIKKS